MDAKKSVLPELFLQPVHGQTYLLRLFRSEHIYVLIILERLDIYDVIHLDMRDNAARRYFYSITTPPPVATAFP